MLEYLDRLAREFVFPNGRKARTFDELALGFQDDWAAARDLLKKGQLHLFFGGLGRADLARAAQEAMAKPDPEMLLRTIARAGGSLERAVMIGDSVVDVTTARAAGVPVIAVDFGYSDVPMPLLKADRVIAHFDELPTAVAALLGR